MRYFDLSITPAKLGARASSTKETPVFNNQKNPNYLQKQSRIPPQRTKDGGVQAVTSTGIKTNAAQKLRWSSYLKNINNGDISGLFAGGGPQDAFDPGAVQIMFDLPFYGMNTATSSFIQVMGVDRETISHARNLQGYNITLKAGMGKGLPLASALAQRPNTQGLIFYGYVRDSYGAWDGTNMSLSLFCNMFPEDDYSRQKLIFHVKKGKSLKQALQNALQNYKDGYTVTFRLSGTDIIAPRDDGFTVEKEEELATSFNKMMIRWGYSGVRLRPALYFHDNGTITEENVAQQRGGTTLIVEDGSQIKAKIAIQFSELIGQPVYNGFQGITVITPMRTDILLEDVITLPQEVAQQGFGLINAQGSQFGAIPKNKAIFSGDWQVLNIRHIGDSHNPDPMQWVTVYDCLPPVVPTSI